MKKPGLLLLVILFLRCTGTSSDPGPGSHSVPVVNNLFEATTPFDDTIRKILGIPGNDKYEMMKWKLTLNNDVQKTDSTFHLIYEYGMAKQGTRGFMEGSKKVELTGTWKIEKNSKHNLGAVLTLHSASPSSSLSFLQPDENILHLLDENKNLLNGSAAWSYTLNRNKPVISQARFTATVNSSSALLSKGDTIGVFEGRTPCYSKLRDIHGLPATGCQLIKCQLKILLNGEFFLKTIYVGTGNTVYNINGKWKLTQSGDASTFIYHLTPDTGKSRSVLSLLKADDNILFLLDDNGKLLVGNDYCSFTLNKVTD